MQVDIRKEDDKRVDVRYMFAMHVGSVQTKVSAIKFFFNQRFMYRYTAAALTLTQDHCRLSQGLSMAGRWPWLIILTEK
jgi:hypothetical protein